MIMNDIVAVAATAKVVVVAAAVAVVAVVVDLPPMGSGAGFELTLHTGIYAFVLFVGRAAPGGVQLCHPIDRV